MKPETEFQNWLVRQHRAYGATVCPMEVITEPGFPDLMVMDRGQVYFTEVKKLPGSVALRPDQYIWHVKAQKAGVYVDVVNEHPITGEITRFQIDPDSVIETNSRGVRLFTPINLWASRKAMAEGFTLHYRRQPYY